MISVAILILAGATQTISTPSETLFCDQILRSDDGRFYASATVEVSRTYDNISSTVVSNESDYRISANVNFVDGQHTPDRTELDIGTWRLPRSAEFPVTVTVDIDTLYSSDFVFAKPDVQVIDGALLAQATGSVDEQLRKVAVPGVHIPIITHERLWGARNITLRTKNRDGSLIDQRTLKTAHWDKLAGFVATAFPALQSQVKARACHPVTQVLVID